MAGHRTLDPGMVVRAHRGQYPPRKRAGGVARPPPALRSPSQHLRLGLSGFVSFASLACFAASLTSRSAARSASFASDSDSPRLWSVLPMLLPLAKPSRMALVVMAGFLVPRVLASTFAAMN